MYIPLIFLSKLLRLFFTIYLKEEIRFDSLHLLRRDDPSAVWYNNVCLIIDDDTDNEVCSDSNYGFSDQLSLMDFNNGNQKFLIWNKPQSAQKLRLYFRGGHPAYVADLKIYYKRGLFTEPVDFACN